MRVETAPPGAEVSVLRNGAASTKLGVTPLVIQKEMISEIFSDHVQLNIQKEGFRTENVMIPKFSLQANAQVQIALKETALPASCVDIEKSMQLLAAGVAEGQRLILKHDLNRAQEHLRLLSTQFPKVSVVYDLLGNSFYLQKDLRNALDSYKKSKELQPGNPETQKMIDRLSTIQGVPSRSEGGN